MYTIVTADWLPHRSVPHPHVTNRMGAGKWGGGIMLVMLFINFTWRYTIKSSQVELNLVGNTFRISMAGGFNGEAEMTLLGNNG